MAGFNHEVLPLSPASITFSVTWIAESGGLAGFTSVCPENPHFAMLYQQYYPCSTWTNCLSLPNRLLCHPILGAWVPWPAVISRDTLSPISRCTQHNLTRKLDDLSCTCSCQWRPRIHSLPPKQIQLASGSLQDYLHR